MRCASLLEAVTETGDRDDTHENYVNYCSLSTGPYVYGLWVKRISQLHPRAAPAESAGNSVPCCRRHVALCGVLFRDSSARRAAVAFGLLRATCADTVGGGTLQHPCVSPDACAGDHSWGSGGLRSVGAGFPSIPRKLQRHLQREACDADINWRLAWTFDPARTIKTG